MPNPDLPAAVVAQLRAAAAVVAAFGESTAAAATTKFHADYAPAGVVLPWAAYEEPDEDAQPQGPDGAGVVHYFCRGRFILNVAAASKKEARQLAARVVDTLNDADMVFDDGALLEFRAVSNRAVTVGDVAPGSPVVYARRVTFLYMVDRTF